MGHAYRYELSDDVPLAKCPHCDLDLTAPGNVELILSIGGKTVSVDARLDAYGCLEDTSDNAVENGFHSETLCGRCMGDFTDYEIQVKT